MGGNWPIGLPTGRSRFARALCLFFVRSCLRRSFKGRGGVMTQQVICVSCLVLFQQNAFYAWNSDRMRESQQNNQKSLHIGVISTGFDMKLLFLWRPGSRSRGGCPLHSTADPSRQVSSCWPNRTNFLRLFVHSASNTSKISMCCSSVLLPLDMIVFSDARHFNCCKKTVAWLMQEKRRTASRHWRMTFESNVIRCFNPYVFCGFSNYYSTAPVGYEGVKLPLAFVSHFLERDGFVRCCYRRWLPAATASTW